MDTTIILDGHYLAYRSFYTTGGLTYKGEATGVIFGMIRDMVTLHNEFSSANFVWTFDLGKSLRCKMFPWYKKKRRGKDKKKKSRSDLEFDKYAWGEFRKQIKDFRTKILPELGFRNVFAEKGYEADDLVASICKHSLKGKRAIIVSADTDLFQLINGKVTVYNPHTRIQMTRRLFAETYHGLRPALWPDVKAIAGCTSDEIPGIKGIGEKTAAKFMARKLDPESKAYKKIIKEANSCWSFNLELVKLPLEGTPTFKLRKDRVTRKRWLRMMDSLGFRTLRPYPFPSLK